MRKILFILHFPPPVHGAAVVGRQIKESKIINNAFDCRYINLGISASVDDIGKNSWRKIFRYGSLLVQVFRQLFSFKPQLCYITLTSAGPGFYKDALVALLVRLFGVQLVYHYHNKGVSARQNHFFDNLLYRIVFKKTRVVLLSKYLYPDIQKYVPESSVFYCPNGVAENDQLTMNNEQLKMNNDQLTMKNDQDSKTVEILFLSNLIASKGVFVLLEACKQLKAKKLDFCCTFVGGIGDVSEQQLVSKIHDFDLTGFVNYAGKKYGNEKDEAFSKADIFAFPTYYYNECFPLVLLEAMQYSLPIVSTFEGGIPDIVNEGITGFLVPQKEVIALSKKLELLITNPGLRQKMGAAGREKYEREFTQNQFENRLKEILESIIK